MNGARRSIVIAASMVLIAMSLYAQPGGEISFAPNVEQLRPIWSVRGNPEGGDLVGEGVGFLGDIYGTGRNAWAVSFAGRNEWRIYRHDNADIAADTVPVQILKGYRGGFPVVGDFWGTGHRAVGFPLSGTQTVGGKKRSFWYLHLHRTESNRIDSIASALLRVSVHSDNAGAYITPPHAILVADLDKDGDDELILAFGNVVEDTIVSDYPEIWIYQGGTDFRVDSPSVVLKHQTLNPYQRVHCTLGDFDGDRNLDIILSRHGNDHRAHMTFYFGDGTLAGYNTLENRRLITLVETTYPSAYQGVTALDCDGDGVTDIAIDGVWGPPSENGTYLFRSGAGADARTRSYRRADADRLLAGYVTHSSGGYLNDNTGTYAMLGLRHLPTADGGSSRTYLFSGGPDGPDNYYDAFIDNAHSRMPPYPMIEVGAGRIPAQPIPDVDGDGWSDYIGGDYNDNGKSSGMAVIYAGGPYIPRDSSTSSVTTITSSERGDAITLWPNPVRHEVTIAWRGDLRKMPARFEAYDALGRRVDAGDLESGRGVGRWRCAELVPGVYMLHIYDAANGLIGTARVVKQ